MTDQSTPTQSAERVPPKKDRGGPTPTYPIWLSPEEAGFLIDTLSLFVEEYGINSDHVRLGNSVISKINVTKNTQQTQ